MSIEIQTHPCVVVRCDRCDEHLPIGGDEGSYAHYEDEAQALDEARSTDWLVADDGLLLCLGCIEDATFYEVACPACGAAVEQSCTGKAPIFCEERIEALAETVRVAAKAKEDGRDG